MVLIFSTTYRRSCSIECGEGILVWNFIPQEKKISLTCFKWSSHGLDEVSHKRSPSDWRQGTEILCICLRASGAALIPGSPDVELSFQQHLLSPTRGIKSLSLFKSDSPTVHSAYAFVICAHVLISKLLALSQFIPVSILMAISKYQSCFQSAQLWKST